MSQESCITGVPTLSQPPHLLYILDPMHNKTQCSYEAGAYSIWNLREGSGPPPLF